MIIIAALIIGVVIAIGIMCLAIIIDKGKPSIEQTAWVFNHRHDHMREGGTFRYLICDRMGYGTEAYGELYCAGGMDISNMLLNHLDEATIRRCIRKRRGSTSRRIRGRRHIVLAIFTMTRMNY